MTFKHTATCGHEITNAASYIVTVKEWVGEDLAQVTSVYCEPCTIEARTWEEYISDEPCTDERGGFIDAQAEAEEA